jgi:hypothetical protein
MKEELRKRGLWMRKRVNGPKSMDYGPWKEKGGSFDIVVEARWSG